MKAVKHLLAWTLAAASLAIHAAEPFLPLDKAEAARLVSPESHGGPAVVALWSSDCVHCKKNLQLFAALAKRRPEVKIVTVTVEPVEDATAEPLDRLGVPGPRFAYGAQSPEALSYALDSTWRGELPRTLFFDGRGGKAAVSGVVTEEAALRLLALPAR